MSEPRIAAESRFIFIFSVSVLPAVAGFKISFSLALYILQVGPMRCTVRVEGRERKKEKKERARNEKAGEKGASRKARVGTQRVGILFRDKIVLRHALFSLNFFFFFSFFFSFFSIFDELSRKRRSGDSGILHFAWYITSYVSRARANIENDSSIRVEV